ncbi:hypothetical protein ZWY2020_006723 [Hordeum vulgare]|nr:hypothetical protein ZWY2020_006723 [Hordeum vulgare]
MLASSCGLATGLYYLASPLTFRRVRLPYQPCDYRLDADPAVVIAFEDDNDDDGSSRGFRHYHLVVAYQGGMLILTGPSGVYRISKGSQTEESDDDPVPDDVVEHDTWVQSSRGNVRLYDFHIVYNFFGFDHLS